MKIITLISVILTVLAVVSTMICGLWIRANNITDPSSLSFHRTMGIVSVVCCIITAVLVIILLRKL
ncbi:MAG: hypothetical protein LBH74_06725 [Nitrososphaerota archaeon]|jgi:hypothetical protein|nr:hypothetical protein [Nitrososphaerota archaeon]